jgi:hypothetical protein
MSVEIRTDTKRTITFLLGEITLHEESGVVSFGTIHKTVDPSKIREFAAVLNDVAVMMENTK